VLFLSVLVLVGIVVVLVVDMLDFELNRNSDVSNMRRNHNRGCIRQMETSNRAHNPPPQTRQRTTKHHHDQHNFDDRRKKILMSDFPVHWKISNDFWVPQKRRHHALPTQTKNKPVERDGREGRETREGHEVPNIVTTRFFEMQH